LANTKKKKNNARRINRACLPNTPLAKNRKLRNCFNAVFGKLSLMAKNAFFFLLKIYN